MLYRQYKLALIDLQEAVKLSPENRELRRLLVRVNEECREQAKMEKYGSLASMKEIGKKENPPDIVSVSQVDQRGGTAVLAEEPREETAL